MTTPHPPLNPVESGALKAFHYDAATKTFYAKFPNGHVWAYDGVDQEHEVGFDHAASKGKYFATQIKAKHSGRKVA